MIRYYPACLALLNVLLAQGTRFLAQAMSGTYASVYGSGRKGFAPITVWALNFHWWPYLAAGLCAVLLVVSLAGKLSNVGTLHAVTGLLLVEGFLLFMTLVAFVVPFIGFP